MNATLSDHPRFHHVTSRIATAPLLAAATARRRAHRREILGATFSLAADLLLLLGIGSVAGVACCWLLWLLCRP